MKITNKELALLASLTKATTYEEALDFLQARGRNERKEIDVYRLLEILDMFKDVYSEYYEGEFTDLTLD